MVYADTVINPIIVVDTVAPTIDVTYTAGDQTDVSIIDLEKYQSSGITATVKVTDLNLDLANTSVTLTALNNNGETVNDSSVAKYSDKSLAELIIDGLAYISDEAKGTYTITIPFTSEAIYTVEVTATDKAGNTGSYEATDNIYLDKTAPVITAAVDEDGAYTADSDIQYEVINVDAFAQFLNKITFGYFANSEVKITVTAHDDISGVDTITLVYQDEDAETVTSTVTATVDENDPSSSSATFTVSTAFKGTITSYATDKFGNTDADNATTGIGVVAQDVITDADTSSITIAVSDESIANATTPTYYNYDVDVVYTVEDTYSGINVIKYTAGTETIEAFQTTNTTGTATDVDTKVTATYTITAADNNTNNVQTGVTYTDNAGYVTTIAKEDLPVINIDTTVPTISVEYDNDANYNTDYYDAARIATITITERNFNPDETTIVVTGGDYTVLGEWTNASGTPGETDACTWTRQVEFTGSGDYTLTCNTTDLAGNVANELTDTFIIDQTAPTGTVEIDGNVWDKFLTTITFGIYKADTLEVSITSADELSGVSTVEYFISDTAQELEYLESSAEWTIYDEVAIVAEDATTVVVYVKITDNVNNVTYLSSDGVLFDTTVPVISGVSNLMFYTEDLSIEVTDSNLDTVTLNGEAVESTFEIVAGSDATYTVVATDKAGNSTTVTFTTYVDSIPVEDVLSSLPDLEEATPEELEEVQEVVNILVEEVVTNVEKDTAKDDAEIIETLNTLDEIFVAVNANITVIPTTVVVDESIEEEKQAVITDVVPQGLALAVYGTEVPNDDVELSLYVEQQASDEDSLVFYVKPMVSVNGEEASIISNDDISSPVTFRLYLNDNFKGTVANVQHVKASGEIDTYEALPVYTDEIGKYVELSVSEFSEFIVSECVYSVTVDDVVTEYKATEIVTLTEPTKEGYIFSGWSSDDVTITDGTFEMPEHAVVIESLWVEVEDKSDVDPDADVDPDVDVDPDADVDVNPDVNVEQNVDDTVDDTDVDDTDIDDADVDDTTAPDTSDISAIYFYMTLLMLSILFIGVLIDKRRRV